uniref:Uncharacterized protein n=1 Tax=Arundo donax TaxID=35708 RepID=A0A0A9H647_ARUDO
MQIIVVVLLVLMQTIAIYDLYDLLVATVVVVLLILMQTIAIYMIYIIYCVINSFPVPSINPNGLFDLLPYRNATLGHTKDRIGGNSCS